MKTTLPRRDFLRKSLTAAVVTALPTIVPAAVLGKEGAVRPSDRLTVGCIGVGPQGRGVMGGFLAQGDVRVVGLCDVASRNLDAALQQVNQKYQDRSCPTYTDFHELLARTDIDAVLIATPDHWHVPIALAAAKAGKDIYLEKPMGLSVEEDQLLRKTVQRRKRIFQFGTQQRSSREFRQACELVRNGRIGKLKQINVWCSASRPGGSTKEAQVPEGLHYRRWLGPARFTPYTDGKCFDDFPAGAWKTWWFNYDYALGFIAGWGVHPLDIAIWGYPDMMRSPFTVEGKAIIPTEGACNTAVAWDVRFAFPDGVAMQYRGVRNNYDQVNELNDLRPWEAKYGQIPDHGTAFEGTEGWILVYRGGLRAEPKAALEEPLTAGVRLPQSSNHVRNFLDSIKSRTPSICPVEDAVPADILCHLSDIATRLGRKLTWNPLKEHFVKDAEANRKLAIRPVSNMS
ncbi:MAG: Gfo/Idh/MocA family oxidoreductase [Verrucomicrobiota bacterium]